MTETQTMFVEEPIAPPVILDRSTLQRWGDCPHQAWLIAHGMVSSGSEPADVGSAVHAILAEACKMRQAEGASARELREFIEEAAAASRPDIQPQVISSLRRSYPIVDMLCNHSYGPERSPDDILRYDGGAGERSGQLAFDIMPANESRGPIRITCELDLLMATASIEELDLIDWKGGWQHWTAGDVLDSFQFGFYSQLVFYNYPAVNRVTVRVFMTREGGSTAAVTFKREGMYAVGKRIQSAIDLYLLHHNAAEASDMPTWPTPNKCSICPAASRCKLAHAPEADLAKNPEAYLRQYVVLTTAADRMKAALSVARRKRTDDFNFGDIAFGSEKPKDARAKPCDWYEPAKFL